MSLKLEDILNQLDEPVTEKTASEAPAQKTSAEPSTESLRQAIKEAEAALTKTAGTSEDSPVDKLEQMATKLAAADQDLLVKEANMYGAAMADGFVTRLQSYGDVSDQYSALDKTAASDEDLEKVATEFATGVVEGYLEALQNPDNVKTASDAAEELKQFDPELVKMAAEIIDGFVEGYNESIATEYAEGAEKTAAAMDNLIVDCYRRGYEDCDRLLKSLT